MRLVGRARLHERNPRKTSGTERTVLADPSRYGEALGERFETGQHSRLVAFEEVPVPVEDDGDASTALLPGAPLTLDHDLGLGP